MNILLVDDDTDIVENNTDYLERKGYEILKAYNGTEALVLAREADMIVLDVGLPDTDGFSLAAKLADITPAPVLFLTARSDEQAIEQSFRSGCDYMKKPYSIKELLLRIESILSRKTDAYINSPPFHVNMLAMSLCADGKAIQLTPTELSLFMLMLKNRGKTVRYEQLFEAVWGGSGFSLSMVAQHICSMKRKIEHETGSRWVRTIRGAGYSLMTQPEKPSGDCNA